MKGIKFVLTERWYAWEDAYKLSLEEPTVDMEAEPQPKEIQVPDQLSSSEELLEGQLKQA